MRHILSILMENESGAMSRVVGLFSARDYNIDSLAVAATEDKTLSRMTIVTHGDETVIEQITKQLNKLVEVVKVVDLNESRFVERELMLVELRAAGKDRDGNLPRQRGGRYRPQLHHRTHRFERQAGFVSGNSGPRPNSGNCAYRCGRYRSRRAHFENLNELFRRPPNMSRPSEKMGNH